LNRLIFFGEASLRRANHEYMTHFARERNHQGMDNRLLVGAANDKTFVYDQAVGRRSRLGGALYYYRREAA
jgi:hypothetical protein